MPFRVGLKLYVKLKCAQNEIIPSQFSSQEQVCVGLDQV